MPDTPPIRPRYPPIPPRYPPDTPPIRPRYAPDTPPIPPRYPPIPENNPKVKKSKFPDVQNSTNRFFKIWKIKRTPRRSILPHARASQVPYRAKNIFVEIAWSFFNGICFYTSDLSTSKVRSWSDPLPPGSPNDSQGTSRSLPDNSNDFQMIPFQVTPRRLWNGSLKWQITEANCSPEFVPNRPLIWIKGRLGDNNEQLADN